MDYKDFYKIFLYEMPWQVPGNNDFAAQYEFLKELVSENPADVEVNDTLCKIQNGAQITYWFGAANLSTVELIVDTEIAGNFCKVVLTSKNPAIPQAQPPFASDMYAAIKNDVKNMNLSLQGDSMMTPDAIRLWGRLHKQGNKISVFNTELQKYELTNIESAEELTQYIGQADSMKYVFVLAEDAKFLSGVQHSVNIMELKRCAGYPLQELFKQLKKN